uniref:Uncharacterized protein n=1 Tax=Arundo donax TaxID=35708 RepID=A0A0A8YMB3_ARUDO
MEDGSGGVWDPRA